mmetsp:Transcript_3918/g.11073  ORF Transcript_3918/g.11073 Transcript_3918/m.11073 type:complete len:126 (-) Transcript_3918:626-1003(-)
MYIYTSSRTSMDGSMHSSVCCVCIEYLICPCHHQQQPPAFLHPYPSIQPPTHHLLENIPGNSPIRSTMTVKKMAKKTDPTVVEMTMTENAFGLSSSGFETFIPKKEPTSDASVTHSDKMLMTMFM